VWDIVAHWLSR